MRSLHHSGPSSLLIIGILLLFHGRTFAQFGEAQTLLPGGEFPRLQALDIDGDGDEDLAGIFPGEGLQWAQNTDGTGTFAPFTTLVPLVDVQDHALADVNGDGLPDLVHIATNEVLVALNNGSGTFGTPTSVHTFSGSVGAMVLADVLGSSSPEVIVTLEQDGDLRIAILPNNGGLFETPLLLDPVLQGDPNTVLIAGDIDGLYGADIIVETANDATVALMNGDGDGTAWEVVDLYYTFDYPFQDPVMIDVDGDGDLDVAEARSMVVQWAENRLDENIPFNAFSLRVVEPFVTAGIGVFGDLGCGAGASVVYVPSDPMLDVHWSTFLPSIGRFAPRKALPQLPRGTTILLADPDGDGTDDLIIGNSNGLFLFTTQLQPPTTTVEAPALDTVCVNGPSIALPEGTPGGGTWTGTWVSGNVFHRSSVGGTSTVPLAYTWYEPEGCPVGDPATIRVITGPTIQPFLGPVVCNNEGPFEMSATPSNVEWAGLTEDDILDLDEYEGEQIVAAYTDPTGSTCITFMGPLTIWNSVPADIVPAGPFCVNDDPQVIVPEMQWANNNWGGDISGTTSEGAIFDPSQGAGTYTITLHRDPTAPQQCAGTDSIMVVVSDDIPEIALVEPEAYCASTSSIDLDQFAQPDTGAWSGPGVSGDVILPFIAGPGDHVLTYSIDDPGGCSNSEQITLTLASVVEVHPEGGGALSYCVDGDPVQFTATPAGGAWEAPVDENGLFDPTAAGAGEHEITYVYTDPNGCMLVNAPATALVQTEQTVVEIDPVGIVCLDSDPVVITGTPEGIWSGAVEGIGTSALFDPEEFGLGVWQVTLTAEAEGFCPGSATTDVAV